MEQWINDKLKLQIEIKNWNQKLKLPFKTGRTSLLDFEIKSSYNRFASGFDLHAEKCGQRK